MALRTSAISRRTFICGLAVTPAISEPTTAAEARPANLIVLRREFGRVSASLDNAISRKPSQIEIEKTVFHQRLDGLFNRLEPLLQTISAAEAQTMEGLQVTLVSYVGRGLVILIRPAKPRWIREWLYQSSAISFVCTMHRWNGLER